MSQKGVQKQHGSYQKLEVISGDPEQEADPATYVEPDVLFML